MTARDGKATTVARVLGAAACAGCAVLWLNLLYAHPYGRSGLTSGTAIVAWLMIAVTAGGAIAAVMVRPRWMFVVFAVSFFPVGLYLAGTPGLFRWIAVLDLGFLAAAAVLHRRARIPTPT